MLPSGLSSTELDALVLRAQGGDREGFRLVVAAVHRDVRRLLLGFQATEGLAEDVLQATFVRAWESLGRYRPSGTFVPWIKTIARNLLLNELRAQKRLVMTDRDVLAEALVDHALEEVERAEEVGEQVARLRECVNRLDAKARGLIEARYLRGEGLPALAVRLRQSEVWVRVTLFRVRKLLRACMEAPA
jgi:RNA polymerase sigma-70 factor (ECF subfamily)